MRGWKRDGRGDHRDPATQGLGAPGRGSLQVLTASLVEAPVPFLWDVLCFINLHSNPRE